MLYLVARRLSGEPLPGGELLLWCYLAVVLFHAGYLEAWPRDWAPWASFILVPWQQFEFDGDLNLFRLHYDAMKAYLTYLGSRADHDIINYGLGDWYDLGPKKPGVSQLTPIALTATRSHNRPRPTSFLRKPTSS